MSLKKKTLPQLACCRVFRLHCCFSACHPPVARSSRESVCRASMISENVPWGRKKKRDTESQQLLSLQSRMRKGGGGEGLAIGTPPNKLHSLIETLLIRILIRLTTTCFPFTTLLLSHQDSVAKQTRRNFTLRCQ